MFAPGELMRFYDKIKSFSKMLNSGQLERSGTGEDIKRFGLHPKINGKRAAPSKLQQYIHKRAAFP